MWLSEIFSSIQGEGILTGTPSTFVRTSGCNLRCKWCDTPETSWAPKGERVSVDEVARRISANALKHVVLTGGEPLLSEGALRLGDILRERGHHLTIETAASFHPDTFNPQADLFSISPKLSSSTPDGRFSILHERRRWRPRWIRNLMERGEYQLKFVVSGTKDLDEIAIAVATLKADPTRVLLMPEGMSVERIDEVSRWLVPEAISRGWRFADRLHIRLFGHTRGT